MKILIGIGIFLAGLIIGFIVGSVSLTYVYTTILYGGDIYVDKNEHKMEIETTDEFERTSIRLTPGRAYGWYMFKVIPHNIHIL
jgi:hypothetical protein